MELTRVTAFCPGHISGYFLPVIHDDPDLSGSIGAGIVISEGVRVIAEKSADSTVKIFQTDRYGLPEEIAESSPVLMDLLAYMQVNASIETFCHLPIGSGYGMSAAALLGTVHALNALYDFHLSPRECARIAHRIEVQHQSGLGDISACQGGGFAIRKTPGPDGDIMRVIDTRPIYALTISPIKTSSVLSSHDMIAQITQSFPSRIPQNLDDIMSLSREFAEKSGLISREIRTVLTACDKENLPASMTMLGCGVFALGKRAETVLKKFGEIFKLTISPGGPAILFGERSS